MHWNNDRREFSDNAVWYLRNRVRNMDIDIVHDYLQRQHRDRYRSDESVLYRRGPGHDLWSRYVDFKWLDVRWMEHRGQWHRKYNRGRVKLRRRG